MSVLHQLPFPRVHENISTIRTLESVRFSVKDPPKSAGRSRKGSQAAGTGFTTRGTRGYREEQEAERRQGSKGDRRRAPVAPRSAVSLFVGSASRESFCHLGLGLRETVRQVEQLARPLGGLVLEAGLPGLIAGL